MHSSTSIENNSGQDSVTLARDAASGNSNARKQINELVHPIICYQTDRFCKRFCAENKFLYRCTLPSSWGNAPNDALLCEWGNASYTWMLNDLTNEKRLQQFEGKNGARLQDYLYRIANSLPFYERWKDWRFGRRVNVPEYVKEIDPHAAKIYFALRRGESLALIAQNLQLAEQRVDDVAQKIVISLTRRNRLYLLNPEREHSLSESGQQDNDSAHEPGVDTDLPSHDPDPETLERSEHLHEAWQQLTPVEQFVLEALVIDEQDANDVLTALKTLKIQIKKNVPAEQTDRQQLYYFRRKTLAKLAEIMGNE
ncbi:hypothetical protein [Kaarinaea lacus]